MSGNATVARPPVGLPLEQLKATSLAGLTALAGMARGAWQARSTDGKATYLVMELPGDVLPDVPVPEAEMLLASVPSPRLRGALERAFERGELQASRILAGEEMLDPASMADRLGITRQTVHAWGKSGKLLALSSAKRGVRYPEWQLDGTDQPLRGLKELADALGGGGWTLYRFLMQTHPELGGRRGLDVLRQNRLDDLLRVADGMGAGSFT